MDQKSGIQKQTKRSEKISLRKSANDFHFFFYCKLIQFQTAKRKPAHGGLNKDKICEEVCIITEYFEKKKKKTSLLKSL